MKNKGFTLLEVLIATAILAGAMLVIGNTWSGNLLRVRKANLYNNVSFLLESKVSELDAKYRDKPITEIPESEEGTFEGQPNYRWTMTSKELELPDMSAALVKQNDGANDQLLQMVKQLSETISKAVKEVKVSVFVKSGAREVEFSVTTYFVDFDKEMALGGGG